MKIFLLIITVIVSQLHAQKRVSHTFDSAQVRTLQVDGDSIIKIDVATIETSNIEIVMQSEGELSTEIILKTTLSNDTLYVKTEFQPFFKFSNNKLSAHKVVATTLKIIMPNTKNLNVNSDIANIYINGSFKQLNASLREGSIFTDLKNTNVKISAHSGNINLNLDKGNINAITKYGNIFESAIPYGTNYVQLQSVNGDIYIKNIK